MTAETTSRKVEQGDHLHEPVHVGGLDQSIRIEMVGDLHEYGAPGRVVTTSETLAAI